MNGTDQRFDESWDFDDVTGTAHDDVYGEQPTAEDVARAETFLTPPPTGWLHDDFALSYGEGVYYSFPVLYLGSIKLKQSLRKVDFAVRQKVIKEAIHLVREASKTRKPVDRAQFDAVKPFLDGMEPVIDIRDIDLSISTAGIVWATCNQDEIIANHRMPTISFALGGDFEDYEIAAYVAKSRGDSRECHIFDCGTFSNQVLATVGQAFVFAGQEIEVPAEYRDLELIEEEVEYEDQGEYTNRGQLGDYSFQGIENQVIYSNYRDGSLGCDQQYADGYGSMADYQDDASEDAYAVLPFQGEHIVDSRDMQGFSYADAEHDVQFDGAGPTYRHHFDASQGADESGMDDTYDQQSRQSKARSVLRHHAVNAEVMKKQLSRKQISMAALHREGSGAIHSAQLSRSASASKSPAGCVAMYDTAAAQAQPDYFDAGEARAAVQNGQVDMYGTATSSIQHGGFGVEMYDTAAAQAQPDYFEAGEARAAIRNGQVDMYASNIEHRGFGLDAVDIYSTPPAQHCKGDKGDNTVDMYGEGRSAVELYADPRNLGAVRGGQENYFDAGLARDALDQSTYLEVDEIQAQFKAMALAKALASSNQDSNQLEEENYMELDVAQRQAGLAVLQRFAQEMDDNYMELDEMQRELRAIELAKLVAQPEDSDNYLTLDEAQKLARAQAFSALKTAMQLPRQKSVKNKAPLKRTKSKFAGDDVYLPSNQIKSVPRQAVYHEVDRRGLFQQQKGTGSRKAPTLPRNHPSDKAKTLPNNRNRGGEISQDREAPYSTQLHGKRSAATMNLKKKDKDTAHDKTATTGRKMGGVAGFFKSFRRPSNPSTASTASTDTKQASSNGRQSKALVQKLNQQRKGGQQQDDLEKQQRWSYISPAHLCAADVLY